MQHLRLDGTNESMLINLEKAFATAENGYFNAVGPPELKQVKVKYGEADILGAANQGSIGLTMELAEEEEV
ncbi:unnamed protein product, partial [Dovyalis caffra]